MGERERDKTKIEQFKLCIEAERVAGGRKSSWQSSRCHRRRLFGEVSAGKSGGQQYGKPSMFSLDKVSWPAVSLGYLLLPLSAFSCKARELFPAWLSSASDGSQFHLSLLI